MSESIPATQTFNLTVHLSGKLILDDVSFSADHGDLIAVIGPNGSGKTTLLRAIGGLLDNHTGSVFIDGVDIASIDRRLIGTKIAFVPQTPPETHNFTTSDIVSMGRYPHTGRFQIDSSNDEEFIESAMEATDVLDLRHSKVSELSGGERQRVFIARALAQNTSIIVMDEPTANLDIQYQLKILKLMREYTKKGICVVTAIHDLSLASRYADKLILLNDGKVISTGLPEEVLISENIKTSYGISALVYNDPLTGKTTLSTNDESQVSVDVQSKSLVHVICGGGTGGRLIHSLIDAGIKVTAGPLGSGDTDRMVMDILGVNYIPTMAFAPINKDLARDHTEMVNAAELVILCDMPIGANNLNNLEVAKLAKQLIVYGELELGDRDLTDGSASNLYKKLEAEFVSSELDLVVQKVVEIIQTAE